MLVRWTVVIDDGTRPYGPGISPDQRRPLALVIGDEARVEVSLINPVGGVVLLGGSDFLQLNARTVVVPQRQVLTARSTAISGGRQLISISADATKNLPAVRGEFDLWMVRAGARTALIQLSEFSLAPGALGANYL